MALEPVVVALSKSGEATAHKVARLLSAPVHGRAERVSRADVFFPDALDHVRGLFAAGRPVVGVCAAGILVRAVAPSLSDKTTEPPVVAVADDGSVVVPLLGGHRGANRLADQISRHIGGTAAITTAGDLALGVALDAPPAGWRVINPQDAKPVMAALLNGEGAQIEGDAHWLSHVPEGNGVRITSGVKRVEGVGPSHLAFAEQRLTLGVGCSRDCPPEELSALVQDVLQETGFAPEAIAAIGTVDLKADEPAVIALSDALSLPLRLFSSDELEEQTSRVVNPSEVVFAEIGTHSVSEAAALCLGTTDASLVIKKRKTLHATCAVAMSPSPVVELAGRARGRLSIVGIGPGQASWRTPEVSRLVAEAEELVGYGLYIDLLGPLAAGKTRSDFPLGGEEDRCRYALEQAGKGKNVALVCSGDAGIYAMGALVFELLDRGPDQMGVSDAARRSEVVCAPGISALQAAAARSGAPLGHDFCTISLSDLLTPREDIVRRLHAAAEGDFVIAFYNPVSKRRRTLLAQARDILMQHRPPSTPVLLASSLGRPEESVRFRRLDELEVDEVDMLTVVLVGSSQTRLAQLGTGPQMYTPRGYARKIDGDLAV